MGSGFPTSSFCSHNNVIYEQDLVVAILTYLFHFALSAFIQKANLDHLAKKKALYYWFSNFLKNNNLSNQFYDFQIMVDLFLIEDKWSEIKLVTLITMSHIIVKCLFLPLKRIVICKVSFSFLRIMLILVIVTWNTKFYMFLLALTKQV